MKTYIALGSNIGDRAYHLEQAVQSLLLQTGISHVKISKIYETEPVGGPSGQGKYFNAAAEVETSLDPHLFLQALLQVEKKLGRVRTEMNAPRTIDLDLLFFSDQVINEPGLTVPHPRIHDRWFVLKPLCDLAPDLIHPVLRKTVKRMLEELLEKDIKV